MLKTAVMPWGRLVSRPYFLRSSLRTSFASRSMCVSQRSSTRIIEGSRRPAAPIALTTGSFRCTHSFKRWSFAFTLSMASTTKSHFPSSIWADTSSR